VKKVLITGSDSYIGNWLEYRLGQEPSRYQVTVLDVRGNSYLHHDFAAYDVIFHVAALVHEKNKKGMQALYFKINRDLTLKLAKKAKDEGVRHFIFLSTMNVYGLMSGRIDSSTPVLPQTAYGRSKASAEDLLRELEDNLFTLAILRPPMVYGRGCKGNYPKLRRLVLGLIPFFPDVDNQRSMIYIENLIEFVKYLIDHEEGGLHFPQNSEYISTGKMAFLIAQANGKKLHLTRAFNPLISKIRLDPFAKLFGNLTYDYSLSTSIQDFDVCSFEESILRTEGVSELV